ncbi:MAG: ATP-binding protein [archaeon]
MVFFGRKLYSSLKGHLQKKQITVITGMRRTGKTTIVRQLLSEIHSENKAYIDLERVDNREIFLEKNYENSVRALAERGIDFSKKCFIAIDEIQKAPEISSVLKYIYDNYGVKFIVTGSSSYYLKGLFNESLAGRKKIFELFPLDFGEFLAFKKIPFIESDFSKKKFSLHEFERLKPYYGEFVEFGGFPEVVLAQNASEKKDLLSDILSSYINIDVKSLADFRDSKNVFNLMKLLASRVGTRLDYSKLSKLSGLSRQTVSNYVDFFEKTYLIKRIPVFARHPDREIVKAQKLYFSDTGLAGLLFEPGSGAKFENAVFTQLRHKGELCYFSLKSGKEIDFILDKKTAFEAKESPLSQNLSELKKLASIAGIKECRLIGKNKVPKFDDYIWSGDIK